MQFRDFAIVGVLTLTGIMLWTSTASAARISDIRNTKHNFSQGVPPQGGTDGASRTVRANSEDEICVFCHTPHGADLTEGPLWNKTLPPSSVYTPYSSASIDSNIQDPNGASKLCLSCHDGTIAIGSVRNVRTQQNTTISMTGTGGGGTMPAGAGVNTGYTRNLGRDLTNDHPISLTYNSSFVNADGEMRDPGQDPIRVRGLNPRPGIQHIHLQAQGTPNSNNGQVQCISCHDPHIRETNPSENIKFLRFNRLQRTNPSGSATFSTNNDIICLACHTKAGWATSAHAQSAVANETYTNAAADAREFPRGTRVWESACLACHDTHTVSGSRRLLRAGVDGGSTTLNGYQIKSGNGEAAIEETCYACHSPNRDTLQGQGGGTFEVPDIWTDFQMARHMPITNSDQGGGPEVHDIIDADFVENPNTMGNGNRHAECTDCHNPHRVVKRRSFNQTNSGGGQDQEGTHNHTQPHTNIASGVLRGIWGVEPQYSSNSFHDDPSGFTVKRGEPTTTSTAVNAPWVTREYQVCLKCHSNYAFNGGYNGPPSLGGPGLTPSGTNAMTRYTNIAREYNSPGSHAGEPRSVGGDGGAHPNWTTNNHRAWHPVIRSTGRSAAARNADTANWLAPFQAIGTQTMYCTDCHGSSTAAGTVVPNGPQPNGPVWGPHGSNDNFLLKGPWSGDQNGGTGELEGSGGAEDHLCFKCHDFNDYGGTAAGSNSGFAVGGGMGCGGMCGGGGMGGMMNMNNLHIFHTNAVTNFRCNLCHVAVPHGWKNKNFLVNLNDVGPEGGLGSGTQVRNNTTAGYFNGPYYNRATLKVVSFAASGLWVANNCGSVGAPGNGVVGVNWMAGGGGMGGGSEACVNVP